MKQEKVTSLTQELVNAILSRAIQGPNSNRYFTCAFCEGGAWSVEKVKHYSDCLVTLALQVPDKTDRSSPTEEEKSKTTRLLIEDGGAYVHKEWDGGGSDILFATLWEIDNHFLVGDINEKPIRVFDKEKEGERDLYLIGLMLSIAVESSEPEPVKHEGENQDL